jgi:hypothetical protein|tara:strand:- start:1559 stop:2905 length:1347 start_codon:yes stop_codon:yes gene_type:complete
MYGVEVHYMPRRYVTEKTVIREVIESEFKDAYPIEAYVENFEGYGDQTTILSKFGIQSTQEITLTISKERYEAYISPLMRGQEDIKLSTRPKEGDLIYFPLGDRLFEIKFVEHEKPFYQLQKGYVYTLKCEMFRYGNEVIDTDVDEIDDTITSSLVDEDGDGIVEGSAFTRVLNLLGAGTTATATVSEICDGGIRFINVTNRGGGYTYNPRVGISSSPTAGKSGIATATRIANIVACELNVNPGSQSVQRVDIINPGCGYTQPPGIRFIGDGVGAAATSAIGNGVASGVISITDGGSGYIQSLPPTVTFSGVATVSAAATAVVSAAGTISAIRYTNSGLGYTAVPTITIGAPNLTGIGTYQKNETVTGSSSGTTAVVVSWTASTNKLEVFRATGDFTVGEQIVGAASSASYKLNTTTFPESGFTSNQEIEDAADNIIDFTETNPFGMP